MGQGVNGVTGDYSRGAAASGSRTASSPTRCTKSRSPATCSDMYRQIAEVGCDVDARGGIRTGSILVEQMTIAGA